MYLATVPGCCTKKAVGYAIGATARGTDSVVRGDRYGGPQVPVHDRGRRSSYPGPGLPVHLRAARRPPGELRHSPLGGQDRGVLGGSRRAPPSRNERVYQMVHHRKKQGHPGYCPLDRAGIRSETTSLRPGVQDAQRGRGEVPSNKTSSLKDRFQGCPRHARQSTDGCSASSSSTTSTSCQTKTLTSSPPPPPASHPSTAS